MQVMMHAPRAIHHDQPIIFRADPKIAFAILSQRVDRRVGDIGWTGLIVVRESSRDPIQLVQSRIGADPDPMMDVRPEGSNIVVTQGARVTGIMQESPEGPRL